MKNKKDRKQFNVYLDRQLIREIKHACIEEDVRLNHLVEEILEEYLLRRGRAEAGATVEEPTVDVAIGRSAKLRDPKDHKDELDE